MKPTVVDLTGEINNLFYTDMVFGYVWYCIQGETFIFLHEHYN